MTLLDRLAGYFILLWGWKRVVAAFLAGAISALAMAPVYAFPVLFLTFPVFVWLIDSTTADPADGVFARFRHGFAIGWLFGFGYFVAGLWWIGNALLVEADAFAWMLPFAVTLVPALLAVFWGIACGLARLVWTEGWPRIIALAGFLSLGEYLRGTLFTGFPWNTIGYAAMPVPIAMQSASVLGLYGVTALSILVFCVAAVRPLADRASGRAAALFAAFCAVVLAGHVGYGAWRLNVAPLRTVADVTLRLVQPAIDQSEKWSPEMEDRNFRLLLDLSAGKPVAGQDAIASSGESNPGEGMKGVTHLVWPESAFGFVLTERPDALSALAGLIPERAMLIVGALRVEQGSGGGEPLVFNSVYAIDDSGEITGAADKVHLVPFGEYLPFQNYLESLGISQLTHLPGGFEAGTSRPLLDGGTAGRFLPLICYEIIFPGVVDDTRERPDFIVNLTNDAWFGRSPGPYQHLQQAVIRGVEEGLPLVRVANNGISSVTDGAGRTLARLGLGKRGAIDADLPIALPTTVFARLGNLIFFIMTAVMIIMSSIFAVGARKTAH